MPIETRIRATAARAAFAAALAAAPLQAASAESMLAEVQEVYVRSSASEHIFVQRALQPGAAGPLWVAVAPRAAGARPLIVRLAAGMEVAVRDVVEVRLRPAREGEDFTGSLAMAAHEAVRLEGRVSGEVLRVVERRGTLPRAPEMRVVIEDGRVFFVRAQPPGEPASPRTALAASPPRTAAP